MYPFVQMKSIKKGFTLTDGELFQITQHVEYSGVIVQSLTIISTSQYVTAQY